MQLQFFPSVARALLFLAALSAAAGATAASVRVIDVTYQRADVVINGDTPRTLWVGETTQEGVTLRGVENEAALVEVNAKLWTLKRGESTVAQTTLQGDTRGQFFAMALINGVPVRALIDTGATSVALNSEDAHRMGIDYLRGQRVTVQTANGPVGAYRVALASVQVGEIALANVAATVIDGNRRDLPLVLIGMSFLREVEMLRSGNTLVLQRR